MAAQRMAAVDAEFYWMSAKVPSDDFQLWAFAGEPADLDAASDEICRRARACPDLTMRVHDGCALTYPQWVPAPVIREQVVCHDLVDRSWHGCLAAVVGLADQQLDIRQMLWRVHVFTPVFGIPGVDGPGTVVLWQYPHALAGGVRASAMGAWLFGRTAPLPEVRLERAGFLPVRALDAARTHRQLIRDTQAGLVTPGIGYRPLLPTNARPTGVRSLRTFVRHRSQMPGPTVTVAVLAAVSTALSGVFGDAADSLAAEVPMAKPGVPPAYNHFGNIVVGLYPRLDRDARVERIATDLANGRRRFEHPSKRAEDRALAAVPAPVLRWGVSLFDPDARPTQVLGNTVVSSNNRGPADLSFGGLPVVLTATYPPLSSVMGLTHGVHGIGDTIAINVNVAESAIADIDDYLDRLDAAL
jgi:hypothetical protein